mmetsp:Transcript_69085/g.158589  ORF Transcript_69085/g.158589 Transcript_69085/m.158589 type:complete len:136 (+) Transcript_69085:31-438(+)
MVRREIPFSHDGAHERFAEYPLGAGDTYGENLASCHGIWPFADALVEGWKNSPGHRRNLLGPFSSCGIGCATGDDGVTFAVQLLAWAPVTEDESPPAWSLFARWPNVALSSSLGSVAFLVIVVALLAREGGWVDF